MSETQKQLLMDINNISYLLDEDAVQKVKKLALSLLDAKLLKVMPKLTQKQLKELDTTEKIMLLEEYSLSKEQRQKEKDEAIPFEEAIKEAGINIDEIQN